MKKIFSIMFMFFIACTFIITGCGNNDLKDYDPATNAAVASNGGMTVVKGDYLYYVNGYVNETELTKDDNIMGKVEYGAVYRTKLKNGEIQKDEDGFLEKTERIVPKVVGFSNGGFYIHGDYIYYATPYRAYEGETFLSDRVEFHRIRIDGYEKSDKAIFVTSQNETDLDWTFYPVGDSVYLLTLVNKTIFCVNAETGEVVAEEANIESYAFANESEFSVADASASEFEKFVYFTRSGNATGNEIYKLNIATGEVSSKLNDADNYNYTIKEVHNNTIYYTKKSSLTSSSTTLLYKKVITDANFWKLATEVQVAPREFTNYTITSFGEDFIIATDDKGTWLIEGNVAKPISTTAYTILAVADGYAYYSSDNTLNRFNVRGEIANNQIEVELVTDGNKTHKITNDNFVDFDGQRIYVYAEYNSKIGDNTSYYLNYIDTTNLEQRFVGKFTNEHLPAPQESETSSEEDVPYID